MLSVFGISVALFLVSWGFTGHKTIGQIATNHLTPQAQTAVRELLGDQSLADAATWADEARNDPEYRGTASWHFVNVPLGLSFDQFQRQVSSSDKMNVYTALLKEEKQLADPAATLEQKVTALKFIAHFVGDIHQPMHVSRAEDKGGNTIQLTYDGGGTNLHALWDTKLLEHGGLNYQQLAEKYDHPTGAEIKKWQRDPPILWAWESYEISTQLYAEVEAMKGRNIDNSYYEAHMPVIADRIEKAGIRLAGILNTLFKDAKTGEYSGGMAMKEAVKPEKMDAAATIAIEDVSKHMGETVKICSKVYSHKDFGSMALVNIGAAYPNQLLTIVLRNDAKQLADSLDNKQVCVRGQLIDYNGKPEIIVTDSKQIEK
jgi:hypothetical protein